MGRVSPVIDDKLAAWVRQQQMFFVATAPLAGDGLVNLSPKGLDSFRILDELTVANLDLTGSGIEKVAHLRENGRIVIMFCEFAGSPRIVRIHGQGEVLEAGTRELAELRPQFPDVCGGRAIIRVHCTRISDSCGYAVPRYEFAGHRTQLVDWAEKHGTDGLQTYRSQKNLRSLDGLPGLGPRAPG